MNLVVLKMYLSTLLSLFVRIELKMLCLLWFNDFEYLKFGIVYAVECCSVIRKQQSKIVFFFMGFFFIIFIYTFDLFGVITSWVCFALSLVGWFL